MLRRLLIWVQVPLIHSGSRSAVSPLSIIIAALFLTLGFYAAMAETLSIVLFLALWWGSAILFILGAWFLSMVIEDAKRLGEDGDKE